MLLRMSRGVLRFMLDAMLVMKLRDMGQSLLQGVLLITSMLVP